MSGFPPTSLGSGGAAVDLVLFSPRFQKVNKVEIPVLDATKKRDTERLISGSTLRRRGSSGSREPLHPLWGGDGGLARAWREGPWWSHKDVRQPSNRIRSSNLAFTRDGLLDMLQGKERWEFEKLLERHNQRANWFYGLMPQGIPSLRRNARAPLLLELSTRGINLRGSFLASQLDASCREEDQDGDTTVCESSSWWTRRARSPAYWSGPTGIKPIKLSCPRRASSPGATSGSCRLLDILTPRG